MVRACCYFSGGFKKLVGINNSHHSLFSPNIYFVCLFRAFIFHYSFPIYTIRRGLGVGFKTNNKPQIVS
jgi:hypothetical protein